VGILDKANRVLVRFGIRKAQPQLTREQAMGARPVRNPAVPWKLNDDGNVVVILRRRGDLTGRVLSWIFMVPQQKSMELDEVGSTVWQHCDGERTVWEVVDMLATKYKLNKREVEISLTQYLRTLGKRGMLGFVIDEKIAKEAGVADQDIIGLEDVAKTKEELAAAREEASQEAEQDERILAEMAAEHGTEQEPPACAESADNAEGTDEQTEQGGSGARNGEIDC